MRRQIALVVGFVLLAGCTGGQAAAPDPTVPTRPATVPTTATPDVSKVPVSIDAAYVTAVLAALDEVDGRATRLIVSAKKVTPEAVDLLQAIYSHQQLENELAIWVSSIADDPGFTGVLPNPGSRRTAVKEILAVRPNCLWLAVGRDYSKVNVVPGPDRTEYVALQPIDRVDDPGHVNPTPWTMTVNGLRRDGTPPSSPCG